VPTLGGHKGHPPAAAIPHRDNAASQAGARCASLQLAKDHVPIIIRLLAELTVKRDDDYVLPLLSEMGDSEARHLADSFSGWRSRADD